VSRIIHTLINTYILLERNKLTRMYKGWNFNSGNYLFTTDTK